jgi:hypothetical protein
VLAIDHKLTIAAFRSYAHFQAPEVLELYVTGLRLAGLPKGLAQAVRSVLLGRDKKRGQRGAERRQIILDRTPDAGRR